MMSLLANQYYEVIAVSIGVIIMVGSALGQALKKKEQPPAGPSRGAGEAEQRVSLDDLAARRRAELEAEAQGRRARHDVGDAQKAAPLSMAERMRRAHQQAVDRAAATQRRIEEMRRQQAQPHQPRQQQRPAAQRSQQPAARPPQRPQAQRPPARPAEPAPRRTPPRPQPAPRQQHHNIEHDQVHRLLVTPPETLAAPRVTLDRSRHALRQAIIWKEILDKPVGLRGMDYDFPT